LAAELLTVSPNNSDNHR